MKFKPNEFVTLFLLAIYLLVMSMSPSNAQDADINIAVEAWLNDDDETAIPMLSKLANSGDESAMLLLGQIARRPGELSPFLYALGRKKRANLWKAKKGLFGETWLKRVKANKKLADALLSIDDADNRSAGVLNLIELHEYGQAIRSLKRVFEFPQYKQYLAAVDGIKLSLQTSYLEWMAKVLIAGPSVLKNNRMAQSLLFADAIQRAEVGELRGFWQLRKIDVPWSFKSIYKEEIELSSAVLGGRQYFREGLSEENLKLLNDRSEAVWNAAPELEPIRKICREFCTSDTDQCTNTAYTLLDGYLSFLDIQSPVEKVISSERYFSSKRYASDMFRRMNIRKAWELTKAYPDTTNLCIAKHAIQARLQGIEEWEEEYKQLLKRRELFPNN